MNDDRLARLELTDGTSGTFDRIELVDGWIIGTVYRSTAPKRVELYPPHRVERVIRDTPEELANE